MQSSSIGTSLSTSQACRYIHDFMLIFRRIGKELGVDANVILASAHGRRSIDTLQLYDSNKANWDC